MKLGLYSITYLGLWYRGEAAHAPADDRPGQGVRLRRHRDRRQAAARQSARLAGAAMPRAPFDRPTARASRSTPSPPTTTSATRCPRSARPRSAYVRDLIRMTADLGAPTLRVFLAWWGVTRHPQLATYDIAEGYWPIVHEKFSTEEIWGWCREALVECARYAGDAGVTLALQNHKPLINDHHDVLRMIRRWTRRT